MDLSIAVISYNTRDLLLACLQSVQDRTTDVDYEVIVVDNASHDGSAEAVRTRFPHVNLTDVSTIPESSYALLRGLDTLVLAAPRERAHPTHMLLARAVEESRRIAPGRTLITHVGHEISHALVSALLPDGVKLAYDGLVLEIEDRDEAPP